MCRNYTPDGRRNLCGKKIAKLRRQRKPPLSQRMLAVQLQLRGIDLDKNAIHRIENGKRFVRDMELKVFAEILHTTLTDLMQDDSQ